jgi:hypothetical protein
MFADIHGYALVSLFSCGERTLEIFTSILDMPCVNELLMAMLTNQKQKKKNSEAK